MSGRYGREPLASRQRLRSRLSRRGFAPTAGALAWLSTETAQACISPRLAAETTAVAVRLWQGNALGTAAVKSSGTYPRDDPEHDDDRGMAYRSSGAGGGPACGRRGSWPAAMKGKLKRPPGRPKHRRRRRKTPRQSRRSLSDSRRSGRSTTLNSKPFRARSRRARRSARSTRSMPRCRPTKLRFRGG